MMREDIAQYQQMSAMWRWCTWFGDVTLNGQLNTSGIESWSSGVVERSRDAPFIAKSLKVTQGHSKAYVHISIHL